MGTAVYEDVLKIFPVSVRALFKNAAFQYEQLQEIRMRSGRPLCVRYQGRECFLTAAGERTNCVRDAFCVNDRQLQETLQLASGYSLYSYEEEIRQGYFTIRGGHRIGVAGKVIVEGGTIRGIRYITCMNIRLSHQVRGCAAPVLPYLLDRNGRLYHTLILSPPRCGKTTLLRDLIRLLSDGSSAAPGRTVGVVDERSEIAGCYMGVPQNDLGIRTDVLDCCPKAEGMMLLIRTMAPEVVAVDEIGGAADAEAIESAIHCGCRVLATAHAENLEEIQRKPIMSACLSNRLFERFVILQPAACGRVREILNEEGERLC